MGRKKKRRRSRSENRLAMLAILLVVCLLFVVLLFAGLKIQERIEAETARQRVLQAEIEDETERTESIRELKDYMETEDYIRQAAKDRLGLVESGEVVLKSAD